jgi:hypothetical protein
MTATLVLLSGALLASAAGGAEDLPFTLDHAGFVFEWLPPTMLPPVEGVLSAASGVVVSSPSDDGAEYHLRYWQEEIPTEERAEWLEQRLYSELPPDVVENLLTGVVSWCEGGMESGERGGSSVGLVVALNFNIITESGSIRGRGRAYGAFRNGYSLLVYGIAPYESSRVLTSSVDSIVSHMHI